MTPKEATAEINNGYRITVIPYGKGSPMAGHLGGEIAADDANKTFYVHEITVVAMGMNSIINACKRYSNA